MLNLITGCVLGLICFYAGWQYAHQTISIECRRFDSFYVGVSSFKCTSIETQNQPQPDKSVRYKDTK